MEVFMKKNKSEIGSETSSPSLSRSPRQRQIKLAVGIALPVLIVLVCFLALRAWGVYTMDNWAYFATRQCRSLSPTSLAPFEGYGQTASYSYDTDAEGFELKATVTIQYVEWGKTSDKRDEIKEVYTDYYRFDNHAHAEAFFNSLGNEEGRNRYVTGRYVFDRPTHIDPAYIEEGNGFQQAVIDSYAVPAGEIVYYLFVEFSIGHLK